MNQLRTIIIDDETNARKVLTNVLHLLCPEQFTVEVNGVAGQRVQFDLINLNRRSMIMQSHQVDDDGHIERLALPADAAPGLYLLKVSADKQTKALKVVKQ